MSRPAAQASVGGECTIAAREKVSGFFRKHAGHGLKRISTDKKIKQNRSVGKQVIPKIRL
jgi:hypothetical protein